MKSILKYTLILLAGSLLFPLRGSANNLTISNYYPSAQGYYDKFFLLPRSSDLTNPCTIGSFYINSSGVLQFCRDNAGSGEWGNVGDIWTQASDNIYLTDTDNDDHLNIGIGTTTPQFKLTLSEGGILAKGTFGSGTTLPSLGAGSRLIWYPRRAALRAGYVSGTQWDDANIGNYSMAFGKDTTSSGLATVVTGGDTNTASGDYALVAGGKQNTASARAATVLGGYNNTASGQWATINGGSTNEASGDYTTIAGGHTNTASGIYSSIGGGENNLATGDYSTIRGGSGNTNYSDVGYYSASYSTIGGGEGNIVWSDYQTISGGQYNGNTTESTGDYLTILGGTYNGTVQRDAFYPRPIVWPNDYATILGGDFNAVNGGLYAVVGGSNNEVNSTYGVTIGGFANNRLWETDDINYNYLQLKDYVTQSNVTLGGYYNSSGIKYSTIVGGALNRTWGDYSFAAGRGMKLGSIATPANRSFLWGYDGAAALPSTPTSVVTTTTSNAFMIATGRVGIRDLIPAALLEINANSTTDNYLRIGKASKGNIFVINKDANAAIKVKLGSGNASPTNAWDVTTANNAYLTTGGVWTNASSRAYKDHINPLHYEESYQAFHALKPVTFNYRRDHSPSVGFIAEEVPDFVAMNDHQTISAMDVTALLTEIAQHQDEQIRQQTQELQDIEKRILAIKAKAKYYKKVQP